jgi:hypothetical protein
MQKEKEKQEMKRQEENSEISKKLVSKPRFLILKI